MQKQRIIQFFIFTLIFLISMSAMSQFGQPAREAKKSEFKMQKRFYIGGGLGFGISSYSTNLMIAPVVGYRLSPSVDVGTRITYNYYRYNDDFIKYSTNNYGVGFFARYYLFFFNDLFIHGEYEALNYEQVFLDYNNQTSKERVWVSGLFLGGGYRQWIGSNAFVGFEVLWNVLDNINSPYSNTIIRIGVGVGI